MIAAATLDHYEGQESFIYRIRLNRTVKDALDGVEYVQVLKSSKHDYIVIRPVGEDFVGKKSKLLRKRSDIQVTCNGYVSSGFLPKYWFGTGARYKVKRAGDGSMYICLKEVLPSGRV